MSNNQTTTVKPLAAPPGQAAQSMVVQPQQKVGNLKLAPVSDNELLSHNVNKVVQQDSALMQHAKNTAQKQSGERGLQNSSLAIEASQNAVLNQAVDIAAGDTQAYQQAAQAERSLNSNMTLQTAQNQFQSGENALNRQHDMTLQNDQQAFAAGESALDREHNVALQNDQQSFVAGESALDRSHELSLEDKRFDNQQSLQQDQQEFAAGESALDRELQQLLQDDEQAFVNQLEQLRHDNQLGLLTEEQKNVLARMEQEYENNSALQQSDHAFNAEQASLDRELQQLLQHDEQHRPKRECALPRRS